MEDHHRAALIELTTGLETMIRILGSIRGSRNDGHETTKQLLDRVERIVIKCFDVASTGLATVDDNLEHGTAHMALAFSHLGLAISKGFDAPPN